MENFADSKTSLVADVDCTAGGKELCEKHKVQGYPSIKYGDPNDLKDYNGGRKYDDFIKFAEENLGPTCGPENLDLCGDEDKATLEKLLALDMDELDAKIAEVDEKVAKVEAKGTKAVTKFEDKIKELKAELEVATEKKKDAVAKEKKKTGVSLMKAVLAAAKKKEESSSKKKKSKKQKKEL